MTTPHKYRGPRNRTLIPAQRRYWKAQPVCILIPTTGRFTSSAPNPSNLPRFCTPPATAPYAEIVQALTRDTMPAVLRQALPPIPRGVLYMHLVDTRTGRLVPDSLNPHT